MPFDYKHFNMNPKASSCDGVQGCIPQCHDKGVSYVLLVINYQVTG